MRAEPKVNSIGCRCVTRVEQERGLSFALAVEPVELVEARRELVREVQHWLTAWERGRGEQARGRLLQSLDVLALLVRSSL